MCNEASEVLIEVTPEMVAAGMPLILGCDLACPLVSEIGPALRDAFIAMELVRRSQAKAF